MATAVKHDRSETSGPNSTRASVIETSSTKTLVTGLVFGVIFGFLLQKGGVAKFHILIGQLLLADFTVLKIMMSAVVVGMLGIHWLRQMGKVESHIKPTKIAANVVGGLIFGVGFGLAAYCPGTGAAAVGQGNLDALGMVLGMIGGSWLFAESSTWVAQHVDPIGNLGEVTLHDWIPASRTTVVIGCAIVIVLFLVGLEAVTVR